MTPEEWANTLELKHVEIHVSAIGHPHEGARIPGWQVANGGEIIRAAIAEERERCAKIVEGKLPVTDPESKGEAMLSVRLLPCIAFEIRKIGEGPPAQ